MNARAVAVLVVLLGALGGGALLVYQQEGARPRDEGPRLGQPLLPKLQAAEVEAIALREPGAALTLQRRDAQWVLAERAGFPADVAKVRELVLAAIGLKVGQSEPIGEKDRARLKLDATGTHVEFRGADGKALAALVVGRKYFKREPQNPAEAQGDGRFVLLPQSPATVAIVADPLAQATAASAAWIDKRGFGAEKVKSLEVDAPGPGKWRIAREQDDAGWKLTPLYAGEKLDVIRANSASYSLNRVELADVPATGLRAEETGLDRPITVVATTFDGLAYTLKLGKQRGDQVYATLWVSGEAKPAGSDAGERAKTLAERLLRERALAGQVLLIARSKFDDVLKKRAELLEAKEAAKK